MSFFRYIQSLFVGFIAICLFGIVMPADAFEETFNSVVSVTGDCITDLDITLNVTFTPTIDDGGGADYEAIVVYDGAGTPIGYNDLVTSLVVPTVTVNLPLTNIIYVATPAYRPITIRSYDTTGVSGNIANAQTGNLLDSITTDPAVCAFLPIYVAPPTDSILFNDRRLNYNDAAALIVVYGYANKRGMAIFRPNGALVMRVTPNQISDVLICPNENTLIAQSRTGDVRIYRLANSCEFQINAETAEGKMYTLIFYELYPELYTSYEE